MLHVFIKVASHCRSGFVYTVEGTKKRCLIVERLAGVGDEDCGDTKCMVDDKRR